MATLPPKEVCRYSMQTSLLESERDLQSELDYASVTGGKNSAKRVGIRANVRLVEICMVECILETRRLTETAPSDSAFEFQPNEREVPFLALSDSEAVGGEFLIS